VLLVKYFLESLESADLWRANARKLAAFRFCDRRSMLPRTHPAGSPVLFTKLEVLLGGEELGDEVEGDGVGVGAGQGVGWGIYNASFQVDVHGGGFAVAQYDRF
jgi:hypothetical protein